MALLLAAASCSPALNASSLRARTAAGIVAQCVDYKDGQDQKDCLEGEHLFYDRGLSADGQVSCSSCHEPRFYYGNEEARPLVRQARLPGSRTLNLTDLARRDPPYFWNGRAHSKAGAVFWPLYQPNELGASPASLEARGGDLHVAHALELYLDTRTTALAAFDRFAQGECSALSQEARRGLELFVARGCESCHQGSEFVGEKLVSYRYEAIPAEFFTAGEARYGQDWQLHQKRKEAVDLDVRPPSLRNLTRTRQVWGRFAEKGPLKGFINKHAKRVAPASRVVWSNADLEDLQIFLWEGLSSPLPSPQPPGQKVISSSFPSTQE